jgi:small-conductance mechanosensitive channel
MEQFFNATHLKHDKGSWSETLVYGACDSIEMGARATGMTLMVDVLQSIVPKLRSWLPFGNVNLYAVAPTVGITIWMAKAVSGIKSLLLHKLVHGTRLGMVSLIDRLTDLSIGIATMYNVLHVLGIELNMGLKSLFAASGVSAIVFSLASKGMVEQIVNGLLLQAWDAIEEGDYVRLGDGTEGTIRYIGLLETEIIGSDHVPIRVPNAQITGKKIHLLSRVDKAQFKQVLRFKYSDLDKLNNVLQDMKEDITTAVTASYLDKSPSVTLTSYEADHIRVTVSVMFAFPPGSSDFSTMKERVLFAIAHAVKKNDMEFALPAIQYETSGGGAGGSGKVFA